MAHVSVSLASHCPTIEGFPARTARAKLTVMRQRFQVLRAWRDQASSPKRCIVLLG